MTFHPEIRSDLELPPETRGGPRGPSKWGMLEDLKIGQSAIFRFDTKEERDRFRNTLSSTAHRYGKKLDRKFTVRTMEEDDDGLLRIGVWRLE